MSIKRRVLSASLWSLVGGGGHQAISFFVFIYLARQLSPVDIGLMAFAMVFLDVLAAVSRFGQVETLQRYVHLDDRVTSTAFWILTLGGTASFMSVLLIASILRVSTDHAALGSVLMFLAPLSALQAWNAVPEAILKQRLDYRPLTFRIWIATLAGGLLAVYMVYLDLGVYALVGQRLGTAAVQTVMLWAQLRWRPRLAFDRVEAKSLVGTGFQIMLATLSGAINVRISDAIAGVFLGPQQLGFLRLGWRFFEAIAQIAVAPVSSVALSSFSKLRDSPEQLHRAYLRLTQFMALASLPLAFGIGAVADIFVPLIFGEKWLPSVIVLQLTGFLMLAGTINYFFAPVMVAVGATGVVLRQSVAQVLISALLLGIGARWGIEGVMIAHILRANLVSWYNLYAMKRSVGLRPWLAVGVLAPPSVACVVMVGAVLLAKHHLSSTISDIHLLAVLIVIGGVTYGIALLAGDALGFWRGYVGGALQSLAGAFRKNSSVQVGKDV